MEGGGGTDSFAPPSRSKFYNFSTLYILNHVYVQYSFI